MSDVLISAGPFTFKAYFERARAPATCAAFEAAMPFVSKIIHVRWSGAAVWIPLGDLDFGVDYEDATSHPAPGEIVLYPGGVSETEISPRLWPNRVRQQGRSSLPAILC